MTVLSVIVEVLDALASAVTIVLFLKGLISDRREGRRGRMGKSE